MSNKLHIGILAAGKGSRMESTLPKVLHKLNGKSLIDYVLDTASELNPDSITLVVGFQKDMVKNHNNLVVVYISKLDDKLSVLVGVSKNITSEYNAGNIVKKLTGFIGGSGGGQADLAQAGGGDIEKLTILEKELPNFL